jgi:hypothetical protein
MFTFNSQWSELLTNGQRIRVARFAGNRMVEIGKGNPVGCYQLYTFSNALQQLAPDAQLVYAAKALQSTPSDSTFCASALRGAMAGRSPTPELIQRWDSGATNFNAASAN